MPLAPPFLLGPHHLHARVRTVADYRARQAQHLAGVRAAHSNLSIREPWVYSESCAACGGNVDDGACVVCAAPVEPTPAVFVAGGMWQLRCGCGNCPLVSVDWRVALCYECGACYEDLAIPAEAAAIETVLILRPKAGNRNWLPGETLDTLRAENRAHGLPDGTEGA